MSEQDPELVSLFFLEAEEHIQALNDGLLRLEEDIESNQFNEDLINQLFRAFHSIKGASGMMGFDRVNQLTHRSESLLDSVRSKKRVLDLDVVQPLLESLDALTYLLGEIKDGTAPMELTGILQKLESALTPRKEGELDETGKPLQFSGESEKYLSLFLDDTLECLAAMEMAFLKIDEESRQPGYEPVLEEVNELFRKAHQIKGSAGVMNFKNLTTLAHAVENILDDLRNKTRSITPEMIQSLLKALDQIRMMVKNVQERVSPEVPVCTILDELKKWRSVALPVETPQAASMVSDNPEELLLALEKMAEAPKPAVPAKGEPKSTPSSSSSSGGVQTMRVELNRLDDLGNMSGELIINKAHFLTLDKELRQLLHPKNLLSRAHFIKQQISLLQHSEEIRAIRSSSVQNRINQVASELEEIIASLDGLQRGKEIYQSFQKALHQMDLTSSEIQRSIMQIRMVPVGPLFGRFKRVVRDIAKDFNKEVQLILKGEETELDKKMTDELVDPLTHLVRNAVDHGLDTPQERVQAGKPPQGTITLNAFHKGNHICVTVQDDGRGLNHDLIRRKAVEKGICDDMEIINLSEREVEKLIFHPGFSTAQKITNISGRGVGMDIVKKKVEELNGSIEIETTPGQGTTFIIILPLTLAIQKSLVCEIRGITWAIPLDVVVEIVQVKPPQIHRIHDESVVRVREKVIPIQELHQIFRKTEFVKPMLTSSYEGEPTLVILNVNREQVALHVDRLFGEQEIVVKSLSQNLHDVRGVSGASVLGDGRVALILDTGGMLDHGLERSSGTAATVH